MSPLDLVKPYLTYALLAFAAAGWAAAGFEHLHVSALKLDAAHTAQKAAIARAEQESSARVASENFRRTEADLRARVDSAESTYANLQTQHAATLAAHRATDDKLRDQLAAFARGSSTPGGSCAAERATAEAYGVLLANGLRVQEELARGAESSSDAVRTLEASWPTDKAKIGLTR